MATVYIPTSLTHQETNERRPRHGVSVIIDCFNEMHLHMKQMKASESKASMLIGAGSSGGDNEEQASGEMGPELPLTGRSPSQRKPSKCI